MKLYQLDQDKILEYKILRSYEKEKEYKKGIISTKDAMFYNITTPNETLAEKIRKGENIDSRYYSKINGYTMRIIPSYYKDKSPEETLEEYLHLKDYIENNKPNTPCVKIGNFRPPFYGRNYMLLSQEEKNEENYIFKNTWMMPVELASVTLLEQGRYEKFSEDKALLEALPSELYQVLPIGEYNADILKTEIPGIAKMNQQLEIQGKILNKIKK